MKLVLAPLDKGHVSFWYPLSLNVSDISHLIISETTWSIGTKIYRCDVCDVLYKYSLSSSGKKQTHENFCFLMAETLKNNFLWK